MKAAYDNTEEFEQRIADFIIQLDRVDAFVRRSEKRAARVQFEAILDDIQSFSDGLSVPIGAMVIGAQLGFLSGGKVIRGRIPAAIVGLGLGWLYGQHSRKTERGVLEALIARASQTASRIEELEAASKQNS